MPSFLDSKHPVLPALYMMIAVVSYSIVPILFKLGYAEKSPFLFTGIRNGSVGIGVGAIILYFNRNLLLMPKVLEDIKSHFNWKMLLNPAAGEGVKSRRKAGLMLLATIGHCGFALFALGLTFVDVSVAAILFETSPLILMLLMAFLFKDSQRYHATSMSTLIFVLFALAGVALVILSHNEDPHPLRAIGANFANSGTLFGAFLVLTAAILAAAHGACTLKLGASLAETHKAGEIVFVMVMTCIGQGISGGVLCLIGLFLSETFSWHQLSYAVMGALFVSSIGIFSFRAANLKTKDLGVNALFFATPLVTLLWLWMLSILDVSHPDYLIIGALGVVAANLLINVDASKRIAYKALLMSLWVFGTVTYFTDGLETNVPLELPVTVFILVLAFRVDRLVRRTGQEEEWVIDMFRRLKCMATEKQTSAKASKILEAASETLLKVDHHKSVEDLKNEYESMVAQLEKARKAGIASSEVTEIIRLVDKLAHSRQQGSRFGEIVAIFLAGALIVFGLLVFSGEREVYGEITSFVLSSIVVFLLFNILDLQRDRKDETLVKGKRAEYIVNFGKVKNREKQQYISMVASGVIVVVFAWLFFVAA